MLLTNAVPLNQTVVKFYNQNTRLSTYLSITRDLHDLLLVDKLEDGRFNDLDVRTPWNPSVGPLHGTPP